MPPAAAQGKREAIDLGAVSVIDIR